MIKTLLSIFLAAEAFGQEPAWAPWLERVGAQAQDMGVRPERSETRLTLANVEQVLKDPFPGSVSVEAWEAEISSAATSAQVLALSERWLDQRHEGGAAAGRAPGLSCPNLPAPLAAPLQAMAGRLEKAAGAVSSAASTLGPDGPRLAARLRASFQHGSSEELSPELFDRLAAFDSAMMRSAAREAMEAADQVLTDLSAAAGSVGRGRWGCRLSFGDMLVSGLQDDFYTQADLARAGVIIDLGGRNIYDGPAAGAGPGQLRMVIDLGKGVVLRGGSSPSLGAGILGVGLLYLPGPGSKTLSAADVSLGAGLLGVGAAWIKGDEVSVEGGQFTQGAAAFGLGLWRAEGSGVRYRARYQGQGFGSTQGVGVFEHRGDDPSIEGGLYFPDPREPQGMTSLCQGVGYGPRAFAAGGVGAFLVRANRAKIASSYFAQGSGYWHGLGAAYVVGDGNRLQARRYSQGAGVHFAAGSLRIIGSDNRLINWGVGPGFAWDNGVGLLNVLGDGNALQSGWASASAQYGARAFIRIKGDRNRLSLPGLGSGSYQRGSAAYALASISGQDNRLKLSGLTSPASGQFDLMPNPWGVLRSEGRLILEGQAEALSADWPQPQAGAGATKDWSTLMAEAEKLPAAQRLARWLFLATRADGEVGRRAVVGLLSVPAQESAFLAQNLRVEAFDEMLWVRLALAALGDAGTSGIIESLKSASGMRKAMLLGLLRYVRAASAIPEALAGLSDADWRVRREAASVLGYLLGSEAGLEAGRLWVMRKVLDSIGDEIAAEKRAAMAGGLGEKRLNDLFALLALGQSYSPDDRLSLLGLVSSPFDAVGQRALEHFVELLARRVKDYRAAFEAELGSSLSQSVRLRKALRALFKDPDHDVIAAAAAALGQAGEAEDVPAVSGACEHPRTAVREAAAVALGKMGQAGVSALLEKLGSSASGHRRLAVIGLSQTSQTEALSHLVRGLSDKDESVRLAAVAALSAFQAPYQDRRKDFRVRLMELAASDPSLSVRVSASAALGQIGN